MTIVLYKKTISKNKKAFHDYFVIESIEAGIELCGTEVKSVRAATLNLKDAWCEVKNGEVYVKGMHISPYEQGNIFNKDPVRPLIDILHAIVAIFDAITSVSKVPFS